MRRAAVLKPTCTVLGARGFIGSALLDRLRAEDHEVFAPERDDASIFRRPLGHAFYCIGLTADFRSRPFATVAAHVTLLAELLQKADFDSLLYLSSTRVYAGAHETHEQAPLKVDPNDASDLYNLSKLMGEALCLHGGRANVRVARLSNVVGLDTSSENFLSALIREALSGRIMLRSDPRAAKDYIALDEVVSLLPRIAFEGRERLYNVASGQNVRAEEIVAQLQALTGCAVESNAVSSGLTFAPIDNTRLRKEFAYRPCPLRTMLPVLLERWRTVFPGTPHSHTGVHK